MVANLSVGDHAKITVLRNGQEKTFDVQIGKRPMTLAAAGQLQEPEKQGSTLGIKVAELTPEMARQFNVPADKGVVVVEVAPEGKGDEAGIQSGDLIMEVNHKPVTSVDNFKTSIEQIKKGDTISLLIDRQNASLIVIKLTK